MPEMNGLQATMQIRREEAMDAHVPIVAMTASAMTEERAAVWRLGWMISFPNQSVTKSSNR
jgi:CheY-like chemotaxis protein